MRREELAHLLRAAKEVTGEKDFVVGGSQAILGSFESLPEGMLSSPDADLYPRDKPELAGNLDGAIGEGTRFSDMYGYCAHGVGPGTFVAPAGWEQRLVPFRPKAANGATGWCLEPHDLVLSKLAAGREKDYAYAKPAIQAGLVSPAVLLGRLASVDVPAVKKEIIYGVIARESEALGKGDGLA